MSWDKIKLSFTPNNVMQQRDREEYIDILKVIAAFFTVFYHFAYYKLDYGFVTASATYFPNTNRVFMCLASCCVPIFFMVNGSLLLRKKHTWKSMYAKALKILVLTVAWSFLKFPSWFFKTLAILYMLFPLFQYFYEKKRALYYTVMLLIFAFPFSYNAIILLLKILYPWLEFHLFGRTININSTSVTGFFTMYSVLYFLLGPIFSKKKIAIGYGIAAVVTGVGLVVLECAIYTNMSGTMYDGVNAAFPTYGALLLSVGTFIIVKRTTKKRLRILDTIRYQILPIYLLHMALIHLAGRTVGLTHITLLPAIASTILILIICASIGSIINRIPILCWFVRI